MAATSSPAGSFHFWCHWHSLGSVAVPRSTVLLSALMGAKREAPLLPLHYRNLGLCWQQHFSSRSVFLRYLPSPYTTCKDSYCSLASGNSDWQVKSGWEGSLGVLVACVTSSWASEPGWRRAEWCEVGPQHWPTPRPIPAVLHCVLMQKKSWLPQ